jgi:hypothetical protein
MEDMNERKNQDMTDLQAYDTRTARMNSMDTAHAHGTDFGDAPVRAAADALSFGGMGSRVGALVGIALIAATGGAAAAVGAARLDQIGQASESAELVAAIALFASGLLAAVVCLARTHIEAQDAEIERLSLQAIDAELDQYTAELDRYQVRESAR